MPLKSRFLSCMFLAIFASISILGEGLHLLTPEIGQHSHHHHHHGRCIVTHARPNSTHDEHNFDFQEHAKTFASGPACNSPASAPLIIRQGGVDSHVCKICAFLFQAVSQH